MAAAYFQMEDGDKRPFVIRIEDDELIAHARQLVTGATTSKPHLQGTIFRSLPTTTPAGASTWLPLPYGSSTLPWRFAMQRLSMSRSIWRLEAHSSRTPTGAHGAPG
jgi:hypothetical protein